LGEEKFSIEHAEMQQIAAETDEASKTLTESLKKLNEAEFRHKFATDRSNKVREELINELEQIEAKRKDARLKLTDALATEPRLIADTQTHIENTTEAEARTVRMNTELAECIKQVGVDIQSVSQKMQQHETAQRLLESLTYWLRVHQRRLDTQFDGKLQRELDEAWVQQRTINDRLDELRLNKSDLQVKVNLCADQTSKSEKAIEKLKSEIDRLRKRMSESMTNLGHSTNRLARVQSEHEKVANNLEQVRHKNRMEQEKFRKHINELDERIKQEMTTRNSILASIKRDIAELETARAQARSERTRLQNRADQLQKTVTAVEEKAKNVRVEHERCITEARLVREKYESRFCYTIKPIRFLSIPNNNNRCNIAELEAHQRVLRQQLDAIREQTQAIDMRQQERLSENRVHSQSRLAILNELKNQLTEAVRENIQLAKTYQANQVEQKKLVHAFYVALNELSRSQWEMCDAEQLVTLCTSVVRQTKVYERRFRAGPQWLLLQLGQYWNAVSCRLRVIQNHSQGQLAIAEQSKCQELTTPQG
uniref:Coiled-coil alpha-helical rod protein 1 n=1 Tax=Echinostoma caproni TaxID=27848 RepID=A0A183AJC2_9TREM